MEGDRKPGRDGFEGRPIAEAQSAFEAAALQVQDVFRKTAAAGILFEATAYAGGDYRGRRAASGFALGLMRNETVGLWDESTRTDLEVEGVLRLHASLAAELELREVARTGRSGDGPERKAA